jgi:hypothetical protein
MAALDEGRVIRGVADFNPHLLIPAVGDRVETLVERAPQPVDQVGKGIGKVLILPGPNP